MTPATPTPWIAVTGATGFLGRHVVGSLLTRGIGVLALARRPVSERERVRWREFDLARTSPERLVVTREAEAIIHLAWEGLPNYRSASHLERELPRQMSFVDAAIAAGARRLLIVGTCFEYGMQEGKLDESCEARPDNAYGQAKDALRRYAESACARAGCALVWTRLFYLYGDGQGSASIFSQLRACVERGDETFPMSSGQQVRDYLPVHVAADHLVALAVNPSVHGLFNICSGRPRTMEETVRGWLRENGWNVTLELGRFPYPNHEPFAFWGSRHRLDRALRT
jgi:nucleoside-diphosphate-sugar epimerase